MGNINGSNKVTAIDLEGKIVRLHNMITGSSIISTSCIEQNKLDIYLSWDYDELIKPLVAYDLKYSKNASVRQLSRRYGIPNRLVYSIGLRIGVYGKEAKTVLHV